MNWLNKLERKFGRYAVHNLTTYLIGTYIIGYAIRLFIPDMMIWLYLQPGAILHGQIWRIVSWILVPPQGSLLEIVIMLMLYYSLGTTLERTWGAFRYNVYIFSGILFTVLGAFVLYILYGSGADFLGGYFSTYYINLSIFSCICCKLSGYGTFVVFHPSDQDQVDGTGVWSIHPVPVGNRQSRIAHSDHFITFKFCRVLFIQQEFKTVYTKRTGAQSKIQTTDKTAYDLCKWCKTPLCCLWENRVG